MFEEGSIKAFNHQRGFGFITPNDGTADVFCHISAFGRAEPAIGARVRFVRVASRSRFHEGRSEAARVEPIDEVAG